SAPFSASRPSGQFGRDCRTGLELGGAVPPIRRELGPQLRLAWRGFALHRWQTKMPLLHVVPDTVCPGMWRIRSPDGRLTDMANLTRAKDAAVSLALEALNAGKRGRQSPLGGRASAFNGAPLPWRTLRTPKTFRLPGAHA